MDNNSEKGNDSELASNTQDLQEVVKYGKVIIADKLRNIWIFVGI